MYYSLEKIPMTQQQEGDYDSLGQNKGNFFAGLYSKKMNNQCDTKEIAV